MKQVVSLLSPRFGIKAVALLAATQLLLPVAEVRAETPTGRDEVDQAEADIARNAAVVTASGTDEEKSLASANVTSIGWEEIARRRYNSLSEILQDVPGLYVVDDLVLPSLGVRGVTGGLGAGTRIVKVMINGVPVNFRPDLTAFMGPEYIPVQMIERVEIAKGPLSALYGANAFVATVNVITRGQSGSQVVVEASARGMVRGGGNGFGGTAVAGYNEGDQSVMVSVDAEHTDRSGLSVPQGTFAAQDPNQARYRSFFTSASQTDLSRPVGVFAQYSAKNTPVGDFFVQGGVQRLDAMGEFQLNSVLTHDSRDSLENDWLSARHEKKWSNVVQTALWIAGSRGAPTPDDKLYLTGTQAQSYTRNYNYLALDGGGELGLNIASFLGLKGGVDFNYEPQSVLSYNSTNQAGQTQTLAGPTDKTAVTLSNFGGFLQAVAAPTNDIHLTGNVRVDSPNLFPAQFSWRLAAAKKFGDAFTAKLIAGRAFQSPSATLLYGLPGFGNANNVIGNRTQDNVLPLVPQGIQSVEANVSWQILGKFVLEGAVFGQLVNDAIEFAQIGSNFLPRNQGVSRSVGSELTAQLMLGRFAFQGSGEIVRQVSEGLIQPYAPSLYPGYRFGGAVNINVPELHFNLNARAMRVGPRGASQSNIFLNDENYYALPSYTRLDATVATVGLSLFGGAQTSVSVAVRNMLDQRWAEPGFGGMDLPTLGRTFLAELRQTF